MKKLLSGFKSLSGLCLLLSLAVSWSLSAEARPVSQSHNLFVANIGNGNGLGSIAEITTNGTRFLFATNLDVPYGIVFDTSGNLYVADYGHDTIYEYTNGYQLGHLPVVFANHLDGPVGLAMDSQGNLFEADDGSASIYEFTNGYTPGQSPVIFATNLTSPISLTGLAFDRFGNLFAGNDGSGSILEFPNGYQPGQTPVTFADNLFAPTGLAFDGAGNLFVTDGDGSIYEFATNGTQSVFASGLNSPTGLAFDYYGRLFEGDFGSGDVFYFTTNGVQSTFVTGLDPTFVAFDPLATIPTTLLVQSSANPAMFGQSVTLTASVSPNAASVSTPTGTVGFFDGATNLGSGIVSNAIATLTVSSLTVGLHNIQLNYSGDANFLASSTATNQMVNPAGTTNVLTATPNPTVFGQVVTLTATLTALAPGAGTVAGDVTFYDGATSLGTSTLTNGVATFNTALLSAASHDLTAVYAGNGSFSNSVSSVVTQVVDQAATTITVQDSVNPTVYGQSVTITGTVNPVAPGAGTPTGTITFYDGATSLGAGAMVNGVATLTVSALSVGTHDIQMNYSGDPSFAASSVSTNQMVNPAGTTNALAVTTNPTVYGQPTTLTATLMALAPGAGTVAGNVTFYDGATTLGTSGLSGGAASLTVSNLTAGNHNLTAAYASNGSYSNSTSSGVTLVVNQAVTTTAAQTLLSPTVYGQSVTFTATVTPLAPGAGTPTGSVNFFDGTTNLGSSTISSGVATLTTSALAAGAHTIQMNYPGDANFAASSNSVSQVVNQASTSTSLTTSPNPTVYGQPATLTATLTVSAPGSGTVDGAVTFYDGATGVGSGVLSNGVATLTISNLSVGNHSLVAVYNGSGSYSGSTSLVATQVVNQAGTMTTAQTSSNLTVFGQNVIFTANVSAVTPGAGTPTGTVSFSDGLTGLGSGTLTNGVATLAISTLTVGTHNIQMTYSGDVNFTASSTSTNQVVNLANTLNVLTAAPNPTVYGQTVALTATVTVVAPGTGTVAGNVTFYDGAASLGSGALNSGAATLNVSSLAAGNHNLTAVYAGNGSYSNSTSSVVTQIVNRAETTNVVVSDINPSVSGLPVTYTATVTPVAPGAGLPTGTVIFYYGGTNSFGTNVLAGGTASVTNAFLPAGTNLVTAVYSGDASFNSSTTPALVQTVISLTSPQALMVGAVDHSGALFLQSALMIQYITVSNVTTGTYSAVRVTLHLTQQGITVYDATGTNAVGDAYVQYNYPVPPHGSVTLAVEYYVANRTTIPNPVISVTLTSPLPPMPIPAGTIRPVIQSLSLMNAQNAFLVGFQTQLNATYYVTYSSNLVNWILVLPSVKGNGSEVQWLDLGPPMTQSPPNAETQRYYQIIKAQ